MRELQDRIRAVVQTIDGNMLKRVWQELDYPIDICRVTKGAHIEHFWADFYWLINLDTYITYVWNCILFWQLISKIYQIQIVQIFLKDPVFIYIIYIRRITSKEVF